MHGGQPSEGHGELWEQVKTFQAEEAATWLQQVLSVAACVCVCVC